jgi:aspartyl-tRNA(Asn)/glutamyl-tRNA(Gln) amidotransferase subunit A
MKVDPQLNAFIARTPEVARAAARIGEGRDRARQSPEVASRHPFALKDIYDTAGILTTGHSRTCIDRVPDKDATTVARLKFAHGGPSFDLPWQPARNPRNTTQFTGGSSSGSGAALAARPPGAGEPRLDTGGSMRGRLACAVSPD